MKFKGNEPIPEHANPPADQDRPEQQPSNAETKKVDAGSRPDDRSLSLDHEFAEPGVAVGETEEKPKKRRGRGRKAA